MEIFYAMYNDPDPHQDPTVFRQANFKDMHHVWRIVYHAYSEYIPLLGRTPPTFQEDFDNHVALGNLWLFIRGDDVAGMVVLTPMLDHVLIQALCVDPSLQGHGIGRQLLAFAELRTRSVGVREMRLYTNSLMSRNLRIYRRWGFRKTHVEDYGWGQRIHMRKQLSQRIRNRRAGAVLATA